MSRSPFQTLIAPILAGAVLIAGCSDSATDPQPPVPADVIVAPSSATLVEAGETTEFSATVRDAEGTAIPDASVTWSSSDDAVATVTQAGLVTAVANGTATITAESGTASGTAQVTVNIPAPEPAEVVIEPAEVTLSTVGATETLTATVLDAQGAEIEGAEVTWSSSDAGIVTVDGNGEVEAVSEGTATITAESGTASGTAQVTVDLDTDDAAAIRVEPESVILTEAGATAAMEVTVFDADSVEIEGASVTWTTSDEGVATVDEDGEVTAVGEGTATITAESGSVSASSEVTVDFNATAPSSVTVTPAEITLAAIGATTELTATVMDAADAEIEGAAVVWTTSDASVATVDGDGVVEAVGEGTAVITARFFQVSGTAQVTVEVDEDGAAAIRVEPESVILTEAGATAAMEATVLDADSVEIEDASVVWTTSDVSVAIVDEDGEVTAVAEGPATITAESGSVSASSEVTVDFTATAPSSVTVTPAEVTLAAIGATTDLSATVLDAADAEIEGAVVIWTTSDPDVATVDEDGVVEAIGDGTAIITARYFQVSGTAEVTVEVDG